MAWPPPTLPTTRTNTTVSADTHPADHNAANLAINDIVGWVKPTAWAPLTLINGWANIGGNQAAQYRKVGDEVQLRGMLVGTTNGTTAFNLPAGHRPIANQDVALSAYGGGAVGALAVVNASTGAFSIYAAGTGYGQVGINVRFSTVT